MQSDQQRDQQREQQDRERERQEREAEEARRKEEEEREKQRQAQREAEQQAAKAMAEQQSNLPQSGRDTDRNPAGVQEPFPEDPGEPQLDSRDNSYRGPMDQSGSPGSVSGPRPGQAPGQPGQPGQSPAQAAPGGGHAQTGQPQTGQPQTGGARGRQSEDDKK